MKAMDMLREILKAGVRKHAKGSDATDAEIDVAFKRTIPGTVNAALEACASGAWKIPADTSRRAKMAAKRMEAAGVTSAPPKTPPKK